MYTQFLPKFKIVEINNMAALRMGHVIAQNAAANDIRCTAPYNLNDGSKVKYLENGTIVGLGADGLLANYEADKHSQPMLVFTEELISGPIYSLDQFAEPIALKPDGTPAVQVYPRCLPLYVGDTFTTNNVVSMPETMDAVTYYTFGDAGEKENVPYDYKGCLVECEASEAKFRGIRTTLPAGQPAVELQYLG